MRARSTAAADSAGRMVQQRVRPRAERDDGHGVWGMDHAGRAATGALRHLVRALARAHALARYSLRGRSIASGSWGRPAVIPDPSKPSRQGPAAILGCIEARRPRRRVSIRRRHATGRFGSSPARACAVRVELDAAAGASRTLSARSSNKRCRGRGFLRGPRRRSANPLGPSASSRSRPPARPGRQWHRTQSARRSSCAARYTTPRNCCRDCGPAGS